MVKILMTNLKPKFIFLLFISLITFRVGFANEQVVHHFKKGSLETINKQHKENPYIVTFWSQTCGYCMKELKMLGELLPIYPGIEIISITTDPFLKNAYIERILKSKNLSHASKWVFADQIVGRLYYDVDENWQGELPYTLFFDRQNNKIKHLGTINKRELIEWMAQQTQ